jgi:hypothetical protein
MPARMPDVIREGVIDSWLSGDSRRVTAIEYGISEGAVSNIVKEFRNARGPQRANLLRALSVAIDKTGITTDECAQGYRLIRIMKRMGVNEDYYENFLTDISKRYVEAGHKPDYLFAHIAELHTFLDRNRERYGITSIPQIEEILERKRNELMKLDEAISTAESKKSELNGTVINLQLKKENIESELQWDSELVQTLKAKGLQFETVPRLVSALTFLEKRGFNVFEISEEYSRFDNIYKVCADLELKANLAGLRKSELEKQNEELEHEIAFNSQSMSLGFGLPEFTQLRYLLDEIAIQQGLSVKDAVKKFFENLQEHFYDYVWLSKRVAQLEEKKRRLDGQDFMTALSQMFQGISISSSGMASLKKTGDTTMRTSDKVEREPKKIADVIKPTDLPQKSAEHEQVEPPFHPSLNLQELESVGPKSNNYWIDTFDLPSLIKESITRPLMKQMGVSTEDVKSC